MSPLSIFVPLTKVDVANRLVYGIATAEQKDRSGEVMDYATTKPLYEKWSKEAHEASNGLSKGNLRVMHGKVAAGKLTDITFNDAAKQIEICAKVVDDQEWKKVEEGVYTGFSHGGSYAKRWTAEGGVKKYTAAPTEISLVDLPCLASATFEMIKGEGLSETRHFAEAVTVQPPSNADVAAKAADLAKAAGTDDFGAYLGQAREELTKAALPAPAPIEPEEKPAEPGAPDAESVAKGVDAGVEQVWKSPDGKTFAKKADAIAHASKAAAETAARADAAPALEALAGLKKTLGEGGAPGKPRLAKAEGSDALEKGMAQVSRLASIISDLVWLQTSVQGEAAREGDGSSIPATIMEQCKALGASLVAMTTEEVGELFTAPANQNRSGYYDEMYMAAGKVPEDHLGALVKIALERPGLTDEAKATLEKMGARNSKADSTKIQAMHDHACDLGATCRGADKAAEAGDLQKRADTLVVERDEALAKAVAAEAGRAALKDIVDTFPAQLAELKKMIADQPVHPHLQGRVVTKAQDSAAGNDNAPLSGDDLAKALAAIPEQDRALLLTKVAQQMPHKLG